MRAEMKLYENKNEARTRGPIENGNAINDSKSLIALQVLRDYALEKATKYRWDPWLSEAHEEYLHYLNNILKECG